MSALFALVLATAKPQLAAAIVLHWTAVSGAVAYEVEIADDETFAEPRVHARASGTSYRWDDVPDRHMYWRVRSLDADARLGEWSESKEIAPVFVPPEPQKPHAGAAFALDESVRLEWSASKIFTAYHLTIASDSGFAHVLLDKTVTEPHFVFAANELGTLYWRVRGIDYASHETLPSVARTFTMNLEPPAWRALDTHGQTLTLSWHAARGALRYRVEVNDTTETTTLYTAQTELTLQAEHSGDVRVVAEHGAKNAASPYRHFVIRENEVVTAPVEPSSQPARAPSTPPWARHFWLAPILALGDNLRNVVIFSPGVTFGALWGSRLQYGFAIDSGVFYFSQTAAVRLTAQTQVWVVPATLLASGALTSGRWRGRLGVGLALNSSAASVSVTGAAKISDVRLSPGAAATLGGDVALGPGALLAELRWSYAPRFGTVRFESGGLVLAIGYGFFL